MITPFNNTNNGLSWAKRSSKASTCIPEVGLVNLFLGAVNDFTMSVRMTNVNDHEKSHSHQQHVVFYGLE